MFNFFASQFFNFEFLRVLGTAPVEGAEIGECLEVVSQIRDGNPEIWYSAWSKAAQRAESLGEDALAAGDRIGARWAFTRASNYFRASEFFLHGQPDDTRLLQATEKSITNFRKGVRLLDGDVHFVEIPYEDDTMLPGYLFLPPATHRLQDKLPIIVHTGGFDSIQEELYFYLASGATSRGYAVLTFEGPGQGIVLRREGLHLRPDWEGVVEKVLDWLFQYAADRASLNLDLERMAIFGASMGGYFALRGALDRRIKACVSCDGFYDLFDITRSRMPSWFINSWLSATMGVQPAFGVKSPAAVVREMRRYTLKAPRKNTDDGDGSELLHEIKCPVLVTGAANTFYFDPERNANRIFEELQRSRCGTKERAGPDPSTLQLWVAQGVAGGGCRRRLQLLPLHSRKHLLG